MKKIFGYIGHVADIADKHYHNQQSYYGIMAFAANNGMGKVQFVIEADSEQVNPQPKELESLLSSRLQSGDVLITDLRTLGSSMLEVVDVLSILVRKGVTVYSLQGNELGWKVEPQVVAFIQLVVAEIIKNAGSCSKEDHELEEGKVLGRPRGTLGKSKLDGYEHDIKTLIDSGETKSAIALKYNISRPALQDFLESRKLLV